MIEKTEQEEKKKVLTHKMFRHILRGPMMAGIPVKWLFALLATAVFGAFIVQMIFGGLLVPFVFVGLVGLLYLWLVFVAAQDPMYLVFLYYRTTSKFYQRVVCYEVSYRSLNLKVPTEKDGSTWRLIPM
jgi:type IV secretory pathway VirB3-like protein